MEQNSLRIKVVRLAQRSRRAIRLYTSVYNSVACNSVAYNSVAYNSVAYNSVAYNSVCSSSFSNSSLPLNSSSFTSPIKSGSSQDEVRLSNETDNYSTQSSSCVSIQWPGPKFADSDDLNCNDLATGGESHTLGNASLAALSTRSSASKALRNSGERFSEIQAAEWRDVNLTLLRSLTSALEEPRQRDLPRRILSIREAFGEQWRNLNVRLQTNRSEAVAAAERSDFINLAVLSESLVSLKARCQASEAAYHELSEVCRGILNQNNSKISQAVFGAQSATSSIKQSQESSGFDQQPIFKVVKSS